MGVTMHRERLHNFRGILLTPDTVTAVEALLRSLDSHGWVTTLLGPPAQESWAADSLVPAGREIWVGVQHEKADEQACLNALWAHAVPLGFTPWLRYPQVTAHDHRVLHFFGPWQRLFDSLISEGQGQLAWSSVCAAAQCDVGTWKGDKAEGRFIQAQLHRAGFPCGPVDGAVGPATVAAIRAAGLGAFSSQQLLERLKSLEPPAAPPRPRQMGHLALPGRNLVIHTTGGVKATQTALGASLAIDGPGQLIIEVGERHDRTQKR